MAGFAKLQHFLTKEYFERACSTKVKHLLDWDIVERAWRCYKLCPCERWWVNSRKVNGNLTMCEPGSRAGHLSVWRNNCRHSIWQVAPLAEVDVVNKNNRAEVLVPMGLGGEWRKRNSDSQKSPIIEFISTLPTPSFPPMALDPVCHPRLCHKTLYCVRLCTKLTKKHGRENGQHKRIATR